VELFNRAQKENIIAYLPTGTGKTFIAALLIQENNYETTKPLSNGGRRTVFLAPTVVLAQQQAEYLERHTSMRVKAFYGRMIDNYWKSDRLVDFHFNVCPQLILH
jgi:endoribonuclease Dicer